MVKRILLSLICIVGLLLSACQASTSAPAESSTNPPSESNNIPIPTITPVPNDNPLPPASDTAHWQAMQAYVHDGLSLIKAWPLIMDGVHNNSDGSYIQLYHRLAGAYLIAHQQYPTIRDDIAKTLGKTRPDLLDSLNDFFNTAEQAEANDPTSADTWKQQVQEELGFTANSPAPTLQISDFAPQTKLVFNPLDPSNETTINVYLLNPVEQSYLDGLTAEVRGSVFDPNTWQVQPEADLVAGPITINEQDQKTPNSPYYYQINIPVHGAVDWANVVLKKNGQVVGYGINAKSFLGFPHLMAMRSMTVTQEGRALLPSDTWGSPPISTPSTNPAQAVDPRQALSDFLDKGVAIHETNSDYGITQEEADTLKGQYDDPQLANLDPNLRAGLLLAAAVKPLGGDLVILQIEGKLTPGTIPIPMFFYDDPALEALMAKHNSTKHNTFPSDIVESFRFNDDGSKFIVWGTDYHNEPIAVLASIMAHEALVHDDKDVSYPEEVYGNYVTARAWGNLLLWDLASNNPTILTNISPQGRKNNEEWLALYNSTYIPEDGSPPLSYIGIMSRITGQQTHNRADYNVLPGSTEQFSSFYNMIVEEYKQGTNNSWPDYSPGSEATRQLFKAMFNLSDQDVDQLLQSTGAGHFDQTTGHYDPDYSELLFSNVMDKLAHQSFSDEMVLRIAQALHVTLDGSSTTP